MDTKQSGMQKKGWGVLLCYRAVHPLRDACYRAFSICQKRKQV